MKEELDKHRQGQAEHYDSVYKVVAPQERPVRARDFFRERFISRVIPADATRVVEIGAGNGTLTQYLLDLGANVSAVDISHQAIEILQQLFAPAVESGQLQLHEGDAISYVRGLDHSCDAIVGAGFLHHLARSERPAFFSACRNALAEHGALGFAPEPNSSGFLHLAWKCAPFVHRKIYGIDYNKQVERGTFDMKPRVLKAELEEAGFQRITFRPYQVIPHCPFKALAAVDSVLVRFIPGQIALYMIVEAHPQSEER